MLAHPYGFPQVMSSYDWPENFQGYKDQNNWVQCNLVYLRIADDTCGPVSGDKTSSFDDHLSIGGSYMLLLNLVSHLLSKQNN
jgi:hypothetical protein